MMRKFNGGPGVKVLRYRGAPDQLTAAGIVQAQQLSVIGTERKTRAIFVDDKLMPKGSFYPRPPGRLIIIDRLTADRFQVMVFLPKPEEDAPFLGFMKSAMGVFAEKVE